MLRTLFCSLFLSVFLLSLIGCDQKTTQNVTTKADQALEKVDTQVDTIAKQPNLLQPVGQSMDPVIDSLHQTAHTLKGEAQPQTPPAKQP